MAAPKPKSNYKPGMMDHCLTPGYAFEPLDKFVDKSLTIWEPAVGAGFLSRAMSERFGRKVIATGYERPDRPNAEDFLSGFKPEGKPGIIVTNPPYSQKDEWTEECFCRGIPWAMLMPTEYVSTGGFHKLIRKKQIGIIWFSPRVVFKMPDKGWEWDEIDKKTGQLVHKHSSAQFPVAWFTHGLFEGHRFMEMNWPMAYRLGWERWHG